MLSTRIALRAIRWTVVLAAIGCTSQNPPSPADAGQMRSDGEPADTGRRKARAGAGAPSECTVASDCPGWMQSDSCELCTNATDQCRATWCANGTCMTGFNLCQAGCSAGTPHVTCAPPTPRCEPALGACIDPSCRVRTGVCVAVDAGDPNAIVSMPACDGGGLNLYLLHSGKVPVLHGPPPDAGAPPSCELTGPCRQQHRSRGLLRARP